ncbi:MAG: hypothetical protein PUA63_01935 [Oscillospiraceae bacterium]|nr:hypothetical protein [Oscillospiraceae bacterium]
MLTKTELFKIDGAAMYAPANEQAHSFEDLDSADSGRDESGIMHRFRVREKVGSWSFEYPICTEAEKNAILAQFAGKETFSFTHPGKNDSTVPETCTAYMSKYSIAWHSAKNGLWHNLKFNIIEC